MAGISESVVREYFELHEFLVRQYRKHAAPGREEDEPDFLVGNPHAQPLPAGKARPFLLGSGDLKWVDRAVISIKPWHTELFSPALLTGNPALFRFLQKKDFQKAVREFGGAGNVLKVMVVPCLPKDTQLKEQSLQIIREKGVDAVLPFRTCLADLVERTEPNRNYQKSDLLQMLRILKNYEFLKDPQLELFKGKARKSGVPNK